MAVISSEDSAREVSISTHKLRGQVCAHRFRSLPPWLLLTLLVLVANLIIGSSSLRFTRKDDLCYQFLREHGVLPTAVESPECHTPCKLRSDRRVWYCGRYRKLQKKKRSKQFNFSVSDFKGTFLEGTHLPAWQLVLFCNHWLQKQWDHATVFECLQWSPNTSVDWRSFCSEVTLDWLKNQQPIGGDGVIVEIDETYFVKRKNNKGRNLSSVWLFGGIERVTIERVTKKFIVPLLGKQRDRSAATLIYIIKKCILPGSTIVSDGWKAYELLGNEGFTHWVVNHSQHFVDPSDARVHTQNIERLWRDLKEWTKRPGMLSEYFEQYFSRYLFLKEKYEDRHHQFFLAAGRLYKPQSTRQRPLPAFADTACDTHGEDDRQPGPSSSKNCVGRRSCRDYMEARAVGRRSRCIYGSTSGNIGYEKFSEIYQIVEGS